MALPSQDATTFPIEFVIGNPKLIYIQRTIMNQIQLNLLNDVKLVVNNVLRVHGVNNNNCYFRITTLFQDTHAEL